MKKLLTLGLFTVIFCYQHASAQLGKGQKMLGGSIGVHHSKSESDQPVWGHSESKSNSFSVNPQLGFGIGNNWIIGLKPGISFGTSKGESNSGKTKSNSSGYGIELFARKFFPFEERFGLFLQGEVGYGFSKGESTDELGTEYKSKHNNIGVFVKPGAYFKVGKRFIVESTVGSIGYGRSQSKPTSTNNSKSTNEGFGFSLSNGLTLGFQVLL